MLNSECHAKILMLRALTSAEKRASRVPKCNLFKSVTKNVFQSEQVLEMQDFLDTSDELHRK